MSNKSIVDVVNGMDDTTRERVTNALLRVGAGELAEAVNEPQSHTDAHEAIALARAGETEWKDIAVSRRGQIEQAAKELGEAKVELAHASTTMAEQRAEVEALRESYRAAGEEIKALHSRLEKLGA